MEEMDSVEAYHNRCMEDTSAHRLLSMDLPGICGIYGEPEIASRIGVEYQAEIPSLMVELGHSMQNVAHGKGIVDTECSVTMGLPIPVIWVRNVVDPTEHNGLGYGNSVSTNKFIISKDSNGLHINSERGEVDHQLADFSGHKTTFPEYLATKCGASGDNKETGSTDIHDKKPDLTKNCEANDYYPVPDTLGGCWSDIEQESFLLGLYIFGKNLIKVKRFIESKEMGDILSFYYGQFYRSEKHRKWSECQKMRSRKSIHGQRIFTGGRQQELLARLLPHASEKCANTLSEVTKLFTEVKVSLEEYVSTLKDAVGLNVLVNAIAIGKGNDLTGLIMEPTKTNQIISTRSDIPIGKACSSLTAADIIKFLTGDFRLSKARSNDLFWEAVWPRLLARGWHSEQPKNHAFVASRHPLVFLVPGIKKFSKRKLVKGNHYFDSITDVLNKVASDPKLLELDVEAVDGTDVKEENAWERDAKSNKASPADNQRPCYLLPRVPNWNIKLMKFTIVDTSFAHGELYKIREMRSLPMDSAHTSGPTSPSSELDSNSSEEQENEPSSAENASVDDQEQPCPTLNNVTKLGSHVNSTPNQAVHSNLCSYLNTLSKQCSPKAISDDFDDRHSMKFQLSLTKPGQPGYLSPIMKKRRLNTCNRAENNHRMTNFSVGLPLKEEVLEDGPFHEKTPNISSSKNSTGESGRNFIGDVFFGSSSTSNMLLSDEKPECRPLIDLNLPEVSPDFGMSESFNEEPSDCWDDSSKNRASFSTGTNSEPRDSLAVEMSKDMDDFQPPGNPRRQSTRNRPLTTKVLEALESGFFSTKRRGRGTTKVPLRRNALPRSTGQQANDVGISETISTNSGNVCTDSLDSKVEGVDEECISHITMLNKPRSPSGKRENPDLHGFL